MRGLYKTIDIIRLAFGSLGRHPGRSMLTALGVIFGVFSVIAMLAINEGASQESQKLLRDLGSDNIIVTARKVPGVSKAGQERQRMLSYGLTFNDVKLLQSNVPGIRRLVQARLSETRVCVGGKPVQTEVIATEPGYEKVTRLPIREGGRFLMPADCENSKPHCLITAAFARELFGPEPITPKTRISLGEGDPFSIIGIVEKLPPAVEAALNKPEFCVIMPMTTQQMQVGLTTAVIAPGSFRLERAEINQVVLQMQDEQGVLAAAGIVRRLLQQNHPDNDYEVKVPLELIQQQAAQAWLWNVTFGFIAAVSLLVGGIGIMNIMLAGVTERTREIGIRRALGAKRRDIVLQFLTEATVLTIAGGVLGLAMGMSVPWAVKRWLSPMTAIIQPSTMALPFAMAIIVGLLSGIYPARRAARLDPIEALRHE